MPSGGHRGAWFPQPKDIFKSRWKSFYKRCYRWRSKQLNAADSERPHNQSNDYMKDALAAPWSWQYSSDNFKTDGKVDDRPPDSRRTAWKMYQTFSKDYLRPLARCGVQESTGIEGREAQDVIARSLDAGRQGRCDSGLGRAEVAPAIQTAPEHLYNVLLSEYNKSQDEHEEFWKSLAVNKKHDHFYVRRLRQLCEEYEIVWEKGQADDAAEDNESPRGRFPYIDEQASLVDELSLKSILRLRHKTKRRRSPAWIEAVYQMKRGHKQYLRRREIVKEEVNARQGVVKQALGVE